LDEGLSLDLFILNYCIYVKLAERNRVVQ